VFATLVGPYPHIEGSPQDRLAATIGDQLDAGLGMLSDGRIHLVEDGSRRAVDAWRAADTVGRALAADSDVGPPLVKACLLGPWSAGTGRPAKVRDALGHIVDAIEGLFEAGAPVVQVNEPAIGDIDPDDSGALELLDEVLDRLTTGVAGHLSLALAGGRPTAVPFERLFAAPFGSYLFDLIRSPDDWRLCARVPPTCGLVVGVADARTAKPDARSVSIWGARYAASLGGRGHARVGLSTSAGLEGLPRDAARTKLAELAEAGRLAELPGEDIARAIDPLDVDARSAALGRVEPRPRRG
jgi:hypothetical protein